MTDPLGFKPYRPSGIWAIGQVSCLQGIGEGNNVNMVAFSPQHLHIASAEKLDVYLLVHHTLHSLKTCHLSFSELHDLSHSMSRMLSTLHNRQMTFERMSFTMIILL